MRTKKPKFFILTGRFDFSIIIEASDRNEAIAFANDEFPSLVTVDIDQLSNIALASKSVVKIKSPKLFKPADNN